MSNYNSTLQSNNTDLQAILNTINELPNAGGEQATPVISVNHSNGLITATAGTKTSTHQLAFQPAKTITPSTASQIAVSGGYYTGGNVTVAGDANLVAGNIKSGVSIFGVSGNYAGSGGDTSVEDRFVAGTLNVYTNDRATSIGMYVFCSYSALQSVNFPKVTNISDRAFCNCSKLKSINFPVATYIGNYAFTGCSSLTSVSFPAATRIGYSAFNGCSNLTSANFPAAVTICDRAFMFCSSLTSIYIGASSVCNLYDSNAFSYTGIWSNKGSIFVPSSLVTFYKSATNWAFFSNRIYSM